MSLSVDYEKVPYSISRVGTTQTGLCMIQSVIVTPIVFLQCNSLMDSCMPFQNPARVNCNFERCVSAPVMSSPLKPKLGSLESIETVYNSV